MKMQDVQLMQASGVTMSTNDNWSTMTGTIPATSGSSSQGTAGQGASRPSWHRSTRVEPFIPTAMHKPTSTYMIGSSLIHVH